MIYMRQHIFCVIFVNVCECLEYFKCCIDSTEIPPYPYSGTIEMQNTQDTNGLKEK